MEKTEFESITKLIGDHLARLQLNQITPGEDPKEKRKWLATISMSLFFPNLCDELRMMIYAAHEAATTATAQINVFRFTGPGNPLPHISRGDLEKSIRKITHETLPDFRRRLDQLDVLSMLSDIQIELLNHLTKVEFFDTETGSEQA